MKNKVIIASLLIFIFLSAGLLIYINYFFLPVKVKTMLINRLTNYFGKDVEIKSLRYNPFKGLIIEDIVVFNKTKEEQNIYFKVDRIYGNFLILPIFREKKIIMPSLHIDYPLFNLVRRKDNTLNALEFLKKRPLAKAKLRYQFYAYKIIFSGARCLFKDEYIEPAFKKEIKDLKIGAEFKPPQRINFLVEGKIPNVSLDMPSNISLSGTYEITENRLQSEVKLANVPLNEYQAYLINLPLTIQDGLIDNLNMNVDFLIEKEVDIGVRLENKKLTVRKDKFTLAGNIDIESSLKYDLAQKKLFYKAGFKLWKAKLSGLDYLKEINEIKGDIGLQENKIWSDNLKATVYDAPLDIKGSLEDFLNPYLKLNLSSTQLNLEKLSLIFPSMPKGITLSGDSTLNMDIGGFINKPPLEIKATSEVASAKLNLPLLKEPLSDIKGKIIFSSNELNWQGFSFLYKDELYKTSGQLTDFKNPQIDFELSSKRLALKSNINLQDKILKIKSCSGQYLDSDFNLKGNVDVENPDNPLLDIDIKSNLSALDLAELLPSDLSQNIKKLKLEGICKVLGKLNGRAKDVKDWYLALNVYSPSFSAYELKLENLNFKLNQRNRILTIEPLSANAYAGTLSLALNSNLDAETPLYNAKVMLSNIDLAKLKMDTKLKNKDLAGLLDMEADIRVDKEGLDTLKGGGYISIKDGKFWHLNLLKGLGEFLFLPLYEKIVFKEAFGNFIIENKAFSTNDLFLGSESVDLLCQGKIGFDGGLDLTMNLELNEDLIRDSANLKKFTSAIFGNLLMIKVSGTIQDPKYKTFMPAKEIINEIKRFFFGR